MKKILFSIFMAYSSQLIAGANYYDIAPAVPSTNVILYIPYQTAGETCSNVALYRNGDPREMVIVRKVFDSNFDDNVVPPLANGDGTPGKWAPHFDGGNNGQFHLGYSWEVKRTQKEGHEQQIYIDENFKGGGNKPVNISPFSVSNGILSIKAERTPEELYDSLWGYPFISGALSTHQMYAQQYGYWEVSAKVPFFTNGLPALWLLPTDRTSLPEIDFMEAPGNTSYEGKVSMASHWQKNGKRFSTGCTWPAMKDDKFHMYGVLITTTKTVFYLDRMPVGQVLNGEGSGKDFYLMMNLAVGGDWVGFAKPSNDIFPQTFDINYAAGYTAKGLSGCFTDNHGVKICH